MTTEDENKKIALPEGVQATFSDGILNVKGSNGEVSMKLTTPRIGISIQDKEIVLEKTAPKVSKKDKMFMNTYEAHVRNMIIGASEGFVYKLKICSGHFPMNVSLKGNILEVKNFLGESVPRRLTIKDGAKVNISGDIITVEGSSKEIVGTIASDIEQLTRITNRDRRVFQDGIYIIEKAGKAL